MMLMPPTSSRKRPAPGSSPLVPQQHPNPPTNINTSALQMSADQNLQWHQPDLNSTTTNYPEPSRAFGSNIYDTNNQQTGSPHMASNQVARRTANQHLVSRGTYNGGGDDSWPLLSEDALQQTQDSAWRNPSDNLEQKAQVARRDAQSKRKQIPPFVQKLSSFLDESRNTELIRWSDNGDSFIVVDEDEFAKTLIPELFKHNNYASFVRQLNMYGFHKRVGLSDNSMRASERKNKSPSEYYNPNFQRGRPNLLWLVQKPKNPPGKGGGKGGARLKQEDGNFDDDGDDTFEIDSPAPVNHGPIDNNQALRNGRQQMMLGQARNTLPQEELANVRRELQAIRQQQQVISNLLQQTREQHKQLYGQAAAFQSLHDRHESSINAILTFLATVYNRSLEGQDGQNVVNMFAGALPQEYQENNTSQPQRTFRRQPLLLKAPPGNHPKGQVLSPSSNSAVNSHFLHSQQATSPIQVQPYPVRAHGGQVAQSPAVQTLSEAQTPSNRSTPSPQVVPVNQDSDMNQIPEADILSMINSANASTIPFSNVKAHMKLPEAFSHLQTGEGQSPLTANERNDMLQLMANSGAATPTQNGDNNALTFPAPPEVPNMQQYSLTKDQLDFLGQTLKDQDQKVNELNQILAPLSPSGSIPGVTDPQVFNGDMLELDQYFNSNDYYTETGPNNNLDFSTNDDSLHDFLFDPLNDSVAPPPPLPSDGNSDQSQIFKQEQDGYDGPDDGGGGGGGGGGGVGRIVGTVNSSETTSPANTIDESFGGVDDGSGGGRGSPVKKRIRKG